MVPRCRSRYVLMGLQTVCCCPTRFYLEHVWYGYLLPHMGGPVLLPSRPVANVPGHRSCPRCNHQLSVPSILNPALPTSRHCADQAAQRKCTTANITSLGVSMVV